MRYMILLGLLAAGACAAVVDDEDGGVGVAEEAISGPTTYRVTNSTLNGKREDLSSVNRMNACVRAWARTLTSPNVGFDCGYGTGRAMCSRSGLSVYIFDCRAEPNTFPGVERCSLGAGIADAGYCLWAPQKNGSSWWSQHVIAGGSVLLGSEPGYSNKWTNP